ncbi:hypothetical protein [Amnibacterium kyonggiense]|uniref:Uncharacterized protein n=1 Tax=Amnibacterium kyonggiense TaxID=595671 RepID=A0A4R7FTE5_9MICO|nr:hypothetical protein [Amnibacterium kyonggiense]TDS81068.1 hypothetical protein CLV52_1642 [Amnibacterium kyonggiense]
MTITTKGGAVYTLAYRDFDGAGTRLGISRKGGPDDPEDTNKPMLPDTWYRVAIMTPLPPEIASRVQMVLDPVEGDADPIVRFSTPVMSVVGVL